MKGNSVSDMFIIDSPILYCSFAAYEEKIIIQMKSEHSVLMNKHSAFKF